MISTTCYHLQHAITSRRRSSRADRRTPQQHTHTPESSSTATGNLTGDRAPLGPVFSSSSESASSSTALEPLSSRYLACPMRVCVCVYQHVCIPILGLPNANANAPQRRFRCQLRSCCYARARARTHTHTHTHTHYIQHGPWSRSAEDDEPATPWATCTRMHR